MKGTSPPRSIVVVGGGVFGASAALSLRKRDYAVTLVDPGPLPHPDASSTDISKVVRPDYGADDFYMELMERSLAGFRSWNQAWGERLFHEDGFLLMTRQPMSEGGFEHDSFTRLTKRGHVPERVDANALRARFPAWAEGIYVDGYRSPQAGWAESGRIVERLLGDGRRAGVVVRDRFAVTSLLQEGSRVTGVRAEDGRTLSASWVVVAAGAWTPTLLPHLAEDMWAVGQPVFHFRPERPEDYRPPHFIPWAADISKTGWYGFPVSAEGIVKVAHHGVGRRVDPRAPRVVHASEEARFRAFLRETFPSLEAAELASTRLCLYCDTRNGDFWIDHDASLEGLVIAAGGSGHAFKFAPIIGDVIADVVEKKPNPYAGRFARRDRGEVTTERARSLVGAREE